MQKILILLIPYIYIINFFLYLKYLFFAKSKIKRKIKKNKSLKNAYRGQECFIFGNGPSLKKVDFSLFSDKIVFTVNMLYKDPRFSQLKSNFHVYSDGLFFCDSIAGEMGRDIHKYLIEKNIKVFFPAFVSDFVIKNDLFDHCYIYNPTYLFNNYFPGKIRLDSCVTDYNTVVFQCIQIAFYMGFDTIYLLGCDCTGIESVIAQKYNVENNSYSYNIDSTAKKMINQTLEERNMLQHFQGWANIFRQYYAFANYAGKHGKKIYNLTNPTILDYIERKTINEVLNKQ